MSLHHRLPGLPETLRRQPLDADRQLVDVVAPLLLQQAVEQHALLHGRERVQVLNVRPRQAKGVQL